jgi:hypothetical protein
LWRIAGIVGGGLAGLASHTLPELTVRMSSKAPLAFGEAATN